MKKVFIDGSAGTTGLRIYERLAGRRDIDLIALPEALRKDGAARRDMLNDADIAFLCLPDDAAREAVGMISSDATVIIDTSTAHRTAEGWAYGFPELSADFSERLKASARIAVPGCHASGVIAIIKPLIDSGMLSPSARLCCTSLTGYSGGGKKMIAEYGDGARSSLLDAPRIYALSLEHKHLKEIQAIAGLERTPIFSPIVSDFYSGMLVSVPLFADDIAGSMENVKELYAETYRGGLVSYVDNADEGGFMSAGRLSGSDRMEITVAGNADRLLIMARYDNLGKGASGAAVQCMNMKIGASEFEGLVR